MARTSYGILKHSNFSAKIRLNLTKVEKFSILERDLLFQSLFFVLGTGVLVMPLYEYECPSCAKTIEIIQKFSDPPAEACPTCGAKIQKKMSVSSFALKGSGWYTTDYKRASGANKSTGSGENKS